MGNNSQVFIWKEPYWYYLWLCGHSRAGIALSNPARVMDASLLWILCCQIQVSASGWSLVRRVLPSVCKSLRVVRCKSNLPDLKWISRICQIQKEEREERKKERRKRKHVYTGGKVYEVILIVTVNVTQTSSGLLVFDFTARGSRNHREATEDDYSFEYLTRKYKYLWESKISTCY
jgi:hypothetical protein